MNKTIIAAALLAAAFFTPAWARDELVVSLSSGTEITYDKADIAEMRVMEAPPPPAPKSSARVGISIPLGDSGGLHISARSEEPPPPPKPDYRIIVLRMRDGREIRHEFHSYKEIHIEPPPPPPPPPPVVRAEVNTPGLVIVIDTDRDRHDDRADHRDDHRDRHDDRVDHRDDRRDDRADRRDDRRDHRDDRIDDRRDHRDDRAERRDDRRDDRADRHDDRRDEHAGPSDHRDDKKDGRSDYDRSASSKPKPKVAQTPAQAPKDGKPADKDKDAEEETPPGSGNPPKR